MSGEREREREKEREIWGISITTQIFIMYCSSIVINLNDRKWMKTAMNLIFIMCKNAKKKKTISFYTSKLMNMISNVWHYDLNWNREQWREKRTSIKHDK